MTITEKVHLAFDNAIAENKFKTFCSIFRKSFDPNFSERMTSGYRYGLSFREWASYRIQDDEFGYYSQEQKDKFVELAMQKQLLPNQA